MEIYVTSSFYFPVLEHVHSDSIRKKFGRDLFNWKTGEYDNSNLVWEILELRQKS